MVNLICIEMRPLLRPGLVFVQVRLWLAGARHGVGRVAIFSSMGGLDETRQPMPAANPNSEEGM